MNKIEFDEFKKIEFDILNEFHSFCEKHKLTYFLACGTLLGAVRHGGFIPWDDDIDVMMPRNDYDKFIELYKSQNTNYGVISFPNDHNCWLYWAKMFDKRTQIIEQGTHGVNNCGLYIDIFVLEGFGDTKEESLKLFKKNKRNFSLIYSKFYKPIIKDLKTFLLYILRFFVNWRFVLRKMKKQSLKHPYDKSKYVFPLSPMVSEKSIYQKELFDERVLIKFETGLFYAPKEYDKVLKKIYGDYMSFPPEDERKPHHNLLAFWK